MKETKLQQLEKRVKLLEDKANFPLHLVAQCHCGNFNGCSPHNFIPHAYVGAWGGSTPPPTMMCTKCSTTR